MKKSIFALAVAGVFAAPVAMADVTIYGDANVSFDSVKNGIVNNSGSARQVSSNISRIGFKGNEDLGNSTSAVFQVETEIAIDGGAASTLGDSNSFVGLSNAELGTALMGRHDTPYKLATRELDLFADTIADNRTLMGQTAGGALGTGNVHDVRATDVLAYISPAIKGVTVAVAYVAGGEGSVQGKSNKGAAWSLAAMYNAEPINASLSYQVVDGGNAATNAAQTIPFNGVGPNPGSGEANKVKALKLGGSYTIAEMVAINAIFEHTSGKLNGTDSVHQNNFYVGAKYNIGTTDAVKLAYTHAGKNARGAANALYKDGSAAHQVSLGYDHRMSKRTSVYALYTKLDNNTVADYRLGVDGVSAGYAAGTANANPSALSFGMKHSF